MKVEALNWTGQGHSDPLFAAKLLIFTKETRMDMSGSWEKVFKMSREEIETQLAYMATTIASSWEFLDVTFLIRECSRATAQQITRTRNASFAMQSQRVLDVSGSGYDAKSSAVAASIAASIDNYKFMIDNGTPLEDARDALPIGLHCNLVAKYNLRTIVDLCISRQSLRVQGPYREMVTQMKDEVLKIWPWAAPFFIPPNNKAAKLLEEVAQELRSVEGLNGAMYNGLSGKLAKAADLLKKG